MRTTTLTLSLIFAFALSATALAASTSKHGAPLPKADVTALSSVLKNPDAFAKKNLIVEGVVKSVCTKKGCWMEIAADGKKTAQGCRVMFKDYGFFVPMDSQGSKVKLAGEVIVKVLPKSHVDHYQGEGGTVSGIQKDGTAREIQFIATGVELTK